MAIIQREKITSRLPIAFHSDTHKVYHTQNILSMRVLDQPHTPSGGSSVHLVERQKTSGYCGVKGCGERDANNKRDESPIYSDEAIYSE